MMKNKWPLLALCVLSLPIAGCLSVKTDQTPKVKGPALSMPVLPKPAAPHLSAQPASLPEALGGMINSDSWIVYTEKEEEEFKGHVSYDNGAYILRSDYALSQRKKNLLTLQGQVYLRRNEPDGTWYELHADKAVYNYKTGKGYALASKKYPVQLIYHNAQGEQITAQAKRADIHLQEQMYQLTGDAVLIHQDELGKVTTLQADSMLVKQPQQYALLQGNAHVYDEQYDLQAHTLEYDGKTRQAYVYGDRPLLQGTTQDGTFAIIADKATAQTDTSDIRLEGQVQGWIVSEQINHSKANQAF